MISTFWAGRYNSSLNMATLPLPELGERKARGAFFTPAEITRFLAKWAIRRTDDTLLEPACGEAAFLLSAAERFRCLGA
jgi:adenine-specific DNA-methyltransferase